MAMDELIKGLAESLSEAMIQCRKAEKRDPAYASVKTEFLLEGLEETIRDLHHRGGIYTEHDLEITAVEYWRDILKAKIQTISVVGGFDLMQKVCAEMEQVDGNDEYDFVSLFDASADGIGGWYK